MKSDNKMLNHLLKDWRWFYKQSLKKRWRRKIKRKFARYNKIIIEDGLDEHGYEGYTDFEGYEDKFYDSN
jgi:hypothetical protein